MSERVRSELIDRGIGLVAPQYPPATGGVERHVEALARGLARRGVRVEVLATDPDRARTLVETRDAVPIRRFATLPGDKAYFASPRLGIWLMRHAKKYALIHAHNYHAGVALTAFLATRWSRVPFVISPHYHGTGHSPLARVLHIAYRPLARMMLSRAARVVCDSNSELQSLHRDFGDGLNTSVLSLSVASESAAPAERFPKPPGRLVVLTVGRLERYKQVDRAIGALKYLPPEYELVVVGRGSRQPELERRARVLGVADRVRMQGGVSDDDLRRWYATADVFVTMSLREAFGLTLAEALAAGCGIVASDIPAHRELVTRAADSALLVDPRSADESLASAIVRATQSPSGRTERRATADSQERMVDAALRIYESALLASG
jgi:glycosyltransferase involved in cell wall biosynthesis